MTGNRAVFTKYNERYVLMHIVSDRAEHIYVYEDLERIEIGTIINCRIDSSAGNISSCFAAFSNDDTAFVPAALKNGTVLPLVYKKEAYGSKKALFSDKLSISGKYVSVTAGEDFVKASSKADAIKKKDYIDRLKDAKGSDRNGIIIRTRAFTEDDGLLRAEEEYRIIRDKLEEIKKDSEHLRQYSILYRPLPAYVSDIMWLKETGIDEVVTDIPEILEKLEMSHGSLSGPVSLSDRVSLRFYEDDLLPLCKLYSFNAKISEALSQKVYLKSGATIVFDHAEAMTVIDVNSAHNDKKGDREDTFLSVNREAACEIARQLRLRNISGMVMIDFITMRNDVSYKELEDILRKELSYDRTKCRFVDFTALGIAELVRDRQGRSLWSCLGD